MDMAAGKGSGQRARSGSGPERESRRVEPQRAARSEANPSPALASASPRLACSLPRRHLPLSPQLSLALSQACLHVSLSLARPALQNELVSHPPLSHVPRRPPHQLTPPLPQPPQPVLRRPLQAPAGPLPAVPLVLVLHPLPLAHPLAPLPVLRHRDAVRLGLRHAPSFLLLQRQQQRRVLDPPLAGRPRGPERRPARGPRRQGPPAQGHHGRHRVRGQGRLARARLHGALLFSLRAGRTGAFAAGRPGRRLPQPSSKLTPLPLSRPRRTTSSPRPRPQSRARCAAWAP